MNEKERKQLTPGLYLVEWHHDMGSSIAAIGMTASDDRWLAPCNWVRPVVDDDDLSDAWRQVKAVSLIEASEYDAS